MTKEITKSFILQQLQDKFGLRDFEAKRFLFDETVLPVYDIGTHLEEWWQRMETKSVTGTGAISFFTIPQNERWTLKRYDVVFMTGAYTVAGVYIERLHQDPSGASVYLDLAVAHSVSYHNETDVVLTRGDAIRINIDGYTTTGDLRLYLDIKKEIIR